MCGVFQQYGQSIQPIDLFVIYDERTCTQKEADDMARLIEDYLNVRQFEKRSNQPLMKVQKIFSVDMQSEEKMNSSFEPYDETIKISEKALVFGIR